MKLIFIVIYLALLGGLTHPRSMEKGIVITLSPLHIFICFYSANLTLIFLGWLANFAFVGSQRWPPFQKII